MSCRISFSPVFVKSLKRLSKRYHSMKEDYCALLSSLHENPLQGVDLGNGLRKVRMAIKSKGKGKSGGARVITYLVIQTENDLEIRLMDIYDKSDMENMSDKELLDLMKRCGTIE